MRLPRSRFTVRRLMIVVIVLAVALRMVIVAVMISSQPNAQTLSHLRRFRDNNAPFVDDHGTTASQYWSEYRRLVLGVRWPRSFICSCKAEYESEMGRPTIEIETSHDMDALDRRMGEL